MMMSVQIFCTVSCTVWFLDNLLLNEWTCTRYSFPCSFPAAITKFPLLAAGSESLLSLRMPQYLSTLVEFPWSKQFCHQSCVQHDCWCVICSLCERCEQTLLQGLHQLVFVSFCGHTEGFWLPLSSLRETFQFTILYFQAKLLPDWSCQPKHSMWKLKDFFPACMFVY